jgi:hypothetical protein
LDVGIIVIPIITITSMVVAILVAAGRKSVTISLGVALPVQANTWDAHIQLGTRRRITFVRSERTSEAWSTRCTQ